MSFFLTGMSEVPAVFSSERPPEIERRLSKSKPGTTRPRIPSIEEQVETRGEDKWTLFTASQNLPAALNDPLNRETDLFTRTWGDSFTPAAPLPPFPLPKIDLGDFRRYLKETFAGRKSHRAIVRELKGGSAPPSPSTLLSSEVEIDGRVYDINTIPKIFLQLDFSLEDPQTFLDVLPVAQILSSSQTATGSRGNGSNSPINSFKLLHEKLTHHLDVVEVHLAHQISMRSDLFFSTLASQRELESLIMTVRQDALELRHKIRSLDIALTHPPLRLYQLQTRHSRMASVCRKLHQISIVHQTQHTIQLLLQTSDFVGALELIASTQQMLQQELQGVKSLRHLNSQLIELEKAIEKMMESDFVHFAVEDIQSRIKNSSNGGPGEKAETELQLDSVVKGLLRRRKLNFLSALRAELLAFSKTHVKDVVETYLAVSDGGDIDTESTNQTLANQMRRLSFYEWLSMLEHVFTSLLLYMRHVKATLAQIMLVCQETASVVPVPFSPLSQSLAPLTLRVKTPSPPPPEKSPLLDGFASQEAEEYMDQLLMEEELTDTKIGSASISTMTEGESSSPTKVEVTELRSRGAVEEEDSRRVTVGECNQLVMDCTEILSAVCDLIHSRCAKILTIRAKHGLLDDLISSEFVQLIRKISQFVNSSTSITGRQCPHLRSIIITQAKEYLEHFHEDKKNKLGLLLDSERWRQADVPHAIQKLTSTLESGFPLDTESQKSPTLQDHDVNVSTHPESFLTVHGQKFAVVSVLLMVVQMVTEYCLCANDLPTLITDVMGRLVDLLKYFNTRTCQLVLGAGAVEAVGLKAITARHLALVLRSLQATMLFMPDIKGHFRRRLTPQKCRLLSQFDQVTEDMGSHCREINKKLMNIMTELITKQLARWEMKQPTPSPSFKTVTKQLLKLHEALEDIVPPEHLVSLFKGIESDFKGQLKSHLNRLSITNNGSTEHGIVNSELSHMKAVLEPLEHISAFGSSLFDIWTTDFR